MQLIRNFIWILQFRFLQPLYFLGLKLSLALMNYGIGVEQNGETYVLKRLWKYADNLNKELVIFDVGANIGQYTTAVNTHISHKRLYSFEPSKNTFAELVISTKNFKNTSLYNFWLSHERQIATLYYEEDHVGFDTIHSCASLYSDNITSYISKDTISEEIELRTMDDFCLEQGINHIDFLKIDIEWHELSCLQGAKKLLSTGSIDMIQIELNRCSIASRTFLKDYWDLLSETHDTYRMLSWNHGLYRVKKYETCLENFTYMNYIFIQKNSPLISLYK